MATTISATAAGLPSGRLLPSRQSPPSDGEHKRKPAVETAADVYTALMLNSENKEVNVLEGDGGACATRLGGGAAL